MKNTIINTITNTQESKVKVESTQNRTNKNCIPVFDITTGKIYASQSDVVKILNSFASDVSNACNGKLASIKGHRLCKLSDLIYHIEELSENMKKYYEIYKRFEKEILEEEIEKAKKEKENIEIKCEMLDEEREKIKIEYERLNKEKENERKIEAYLLTEITKKIKRLESKRKVI